MKSRDCPLAYLCVESIQTAQDMVVGGTEQIVRGMPGTTETDPDGNSELLFQLRNIESGILGQIEDIHCKNASIRRKYGLVGKIVSIHCCSTSRLARTNK